MAVVAKPSSRYTVPAIHYLRDSAGVVLLDQTVSSQPPVPSPPPPPLASSQTPPAVVGAHYPFEPEG